MHKSKVRQVRGPGRAAVIDLGFNSLKLVNYKIEKDGSFESFEQYSTLAQIGEGFDHTHRLAERRVIPVIDELKAFRAIVRLHSIDAVLPVATSAVREAENRDEFLARVRRETGFRFRVLSEGEEGTYSYLGAASALDINSCIFFDLGGGSLELVTASRGRIRRIVSLPLGSLRVSQAFSRKELGRIPAGSLSRMEKHIARVLQDGAPAAPDGQLLVGVGGTLRAIARYEQQQTGYPINKLHNYTLSRERVASAVGRLASMDPDEIGRIEAFKGERAKTVLAGSCIISALMKRYNAKRVTVSTHGLRDGILIDWINGQGGTAGVRERAEKLAVARPPQLAGAAGRLVSHLLSRGFLEEKETRILLPAVTELLRSGEMMRPESLFYAILYEDSFLSHREQMVMALSIIQTKRPRIANWLYAKNEQLLRKKDRRTIKRLASLLELLEAVINSDGKLAFRQTRGVLRIEALGADKKARAEMLAHPISRVNDALGTAVSMYPLVEMSGD